MALLVVPVMQDELQEVEVSRWNRLEEVATDHVGAFGETSSCRVRHRVVHDVGPVEDDPAQRRVG